MKIISILAILLFSTNCIAQNDSLNYTLIAKQLDKTKTINELVIQSANILIGKPYIGGTLDVNENETLVINFGKFDCVTFQETCAALALDAKSKNPSFSNFKQKLESLRYQNGKNTGYTSRLHYSTEWILENSRRGNINVLTEKLGGIKMNNQVNFMSTHSDLYKHLKGNQLNINKIKEIENSINANHISYIPKENIKNIENQIPSGSLIFIATSKAGLDFAHVGIAENQNGTLRLIHASSTGRKVMESPTSLADYLAGIKTFIGIAVAELK